MGACSGVAGRPGQDESSVETVAAEGEARPGGPSSGGMASNLSKAAWVVNLMHVGNATGRCWTCLRVTRGHIAELAASTVFRLGR